MIYVTSDLNFGNQAAIDLEDRPFHDIHEMDEAIIHNWNKAVHTDDSVYVLGNVGVYTNDAMACIIKKLHGTKILILGDEDINRSDSYWRSVGFKAVYRCAHIMIDDIYVLGHQPPSYMSDKVPWIWLYGHVRGEMYKTITEYSACVRTDRWQYTPISLMRLGYLIQMHQKSMQNTCEDE